MKTTTTSPSGSFKNWESETLKLLGNYEDGVGSRLPRGELTSGVFHRLGRATIRDVGHLQKLLPRVVRQVLIDYSREKSRDLQLFVYDYAFDVPACSNASSEIIEEHKEMLLGDDSPLDQSEKTLIRLALEDPAQFINPDGQLAQRAVGRHLGVDHATVRNWWLRILEKVAAMGEGPDFSI
ncbi:MAG: hypothetical protein LV479_09710 [Methylacidiphilales bacterium]|nr:hypothetical protein [Candidatus Methylacidiphilales bacterium]